jgi:hypothetical protein
MDYLALKNELSTDPLSRGYAGMTNAQAAASLNTANRTITRKSISGAEIIKATLVAEYTALSADLKTAYWGMVGASGGVDPSDANTRAIFGAMFGAATTTRANLLALQNQTVSRAAELGLGEVTPGDVQCAKAL